ncbi:response regulator [Deefgea piscis]|uniref:Sensory/regulatory protein RpfC n=1 Tax=Deefgea piscis TaxID=2739061 RepID=A0A6M8SP11_9NEIS|nr:ATP-binding protein [Deefgea piscis]QKJ66431.1 response regulator [Deefgea piscis]
MRLKPLSKGPLSVIAIVVLLIIVSTMLMLNRQYEVLQKSSRIGADSDVWAYAQLGYEYFRLTDQVEHLLSEPNAEQINTLQMRYDIFVSRVDVITNSSYVGNDDSAMIQNNLKTLHAFIKKTDQYLGPNVPLKYNHERIIELRNDLSQLQNIILDMIQIAKDNTLHNAENYANTLKEQSAVISGMILLLLGLTIAFTLLLYRQYGLEHKRSKDLETLNNALACATSRAEQASQSKSVFLANMSHEIRTPMNGILGMLDVLSTMELSEQQKDYVVTARSSAQHLLALLNDILDLSRLESGKIELEAIPYSLHQLLRECMRLMRVRANEKKINLTLALAENTPEWQLGDIVRVRQILLNLLGNAIKFTEEGEVGFCVSCNQKDIIFIIIDTGIGMTPEGLSRLFKRFQQAEKSTARRYGGTGLGLEISLTLTELMQGHIDVQSKLDVGSQFTVLLPRHDCAAPEITAPTIKTEKTGASLSILAADDNPINLKVVGAMLANLGHQVDYASDGAEALAMIQQKHYDMILMDGHMPIMDGLEAARQIRQLGGDYAQIPIIALSADALAESRSEFIAAGMNDFLAKPVLLKTLEQTINKNRHT